MRPTTTRAVVAALAILATTAGCSSLRPQTPGFSPSEVTTYTDAVRHLAPLYGADPEAAIRVGKNNPSELNRAQGDAWEYVVDDPRTPMEPNGRLVGSGSSCVSISSRGVFWYSKVVDEETQGAFGGQNAHCRSLDATQASSYPTIFKLSDDGRSWITQR